MKSCPGRTILLISPLPPPAGGIAIWTEKFVKWATINNARVEIVNTAVTGRRANRINTKRKLLDELKRTVTIFSVLSRSIKHNDFAAVHLNTACGRFGIFRDYLCASAVGRKKIPLFVHYRCNIEDQIADRKIQKYFLKRIAKHANLNITLNSSSHLFLEQIAGLSSQVIPNFIEPEFIIDQHKDIRLDIENIIFLGHVQFSKGIREIIRVARHFPDLQFILAGPVSDEVISLEIPENVILKGAVSREEVRAYLQNADLFLFPTYSEGFSVSLLEAMSVGLPVITTPVGANADMIESPQGGLIVRCKNVEDIVGAIDGLRDQETRRKMSIWNVKKVRDNYLIDTVGARLLSLYHLQNHK